MAMQLLAVHLAQHPAYVRTVSHVSGGVFQKRVDDVIGGHKNIRHGCLPQLVLRSLCGLMVFLGRRLQAAVSRRRRVGRRLQAAVGRRRRVIVCSRGSLVKTFGRLAEVKDFCFLTKSAGS